jgi:hypothetical protein
MHTESIYLSLCVILGTASVEQPLRSKSLFLTIAVDYPSLLLSQVPSSSFSPSSAKKDFLVASFFFVKKIGTEKSAFCD